MEGGCPVDDNRPSSHLFNEFLPSGQLNLYYGGPPDAGASGMNFLHGAFDTSPRRMFIDVMGVFKSMYVPAPERI